MFFIFPETNIFAENGWLEDDPFLLGLGLFSGVMLVLGRVFSLSLTFTKTLPRFQAFAKNAKTRKDARFGGKRYRAT